VLLASLIYAAAQLGVVLVENLAVVGTSCDCDAGSEAVQDRARVAAKSPYQ